MGANDEFGVSHLNNDPGWTQGRNKKGRILNGVTDIRLNINGGHRHKYITKTQKFLTDCSYLTQLLLIKKYYAHNTFSSEGVSGSV